MLEPLTAFGLAASIVQFLDFGGKLLKTGYSLRKSTTGTTEENVQLEQVTSDLLHVSQKLSASVSANSNPLSSDDQKLEEMGQGCQQLALRLLDILEGLKLTSNSSGVFKSWEALRKSIGVHVTKKSEIESITRQLNAYRQQVSTRLLAVIRNDQSTVLAEMRRLEDSSIRLHTRTLDEIKATRQELTTVLSSHQQLVDRFKFWSLSTSNDRTRERDLLLCISKKMDAMMRQSASLATEFKILDSLYFPQMHVRHETIKETYADTFSWIFDDQTTDFKSWLEYESGIFWVRGKAGSGKSTLMKFLSDHERTANILQLWAGSSRLIFATFYFWSAGTPIQKSQEGLLQSLLFQLLSQCPELIPKATPGRWQADSTFHRFSKPWSRAELSDTLKTTLAQGQIRSRFCFFIDGLDEYSGDYHELARAEQNAQVQVDHYALTRDLKSLTESGHVKLCVSSRPWNAFRSAFGDREDRMLVLERLTKTDMTTYTKGMLEEDFRFMSLARVDPRASLLVNEVRDKAEGVFLWVFLAVRSLLRGLGEHDDIPELQRRLRTLPSDLKQFFHRILASVDEEYRPLTCRLLALASYRALLPVTAPWFLRLELNDPEYAFKAKIEPLGFTAQELRDSATTHVNKWCRDLLEVQTSVCCGHADLPLFEAIGFSHRTVRDFLSDPDVRDYLYSHIGAYYDEIVSHGRIHLARAKTLSFKDHEGPRSALWTVFSDCTAYVVHDAKAFETKTGETLTSILTELDHVGTQFHGLEAKCQLIDPLRGEAHGGDATLTGAGGFPQNNFLALAVSSDLQVFVKDTLKIEPSKIRKLGLPLLLYAIYPDVCDDVRNFRLEYYTPSPLVDMVHILLEANANVNECANVRGDSTIWQIFLLDCYLSLQDGARSMAQAFLDHGADVDCKVPYLVAKITVFRCLAKVFPEDQVKSMIAAARQRNAIYQPVPRTESRGWFSQLLPWRGQ